MHQIGPVILIILGIVFSLFAGSAKWIAKLVGAGMIVCGLLILIGVL